MVDVAQLVERRDVAPEVAGSSPVIHPSVPMSQGRRAGLQNLLAGFDSPGARWWSCLGPAESCQGVVRPISPTTLEDIHVKTVRIKAGLTQVVLPNGTSYDGGEVAILTDAEYADLAPTALGDEVLLVSHEVSIGEETNDLRYFHVPISLSDVVDGDLASTVFTPGYAGTIKAVRFITDTPATTAAKLTTLGLKINTTAVTGGAVALTTAGCDTKAEVVAGTAVTAANVFDADDTVKVVASSTTAFVEGSGFVEILVVTS